MVASYKRPPTTTTNTFRREQCGSNFAEGQMSTHLPYSARSQFFLRKTHFHPLLRDASSSQPSDFLPKKTFTDYHQCVEHFLLLRKNLL